jgi:hypothetical protein
MTLPAPGKAISANNINVEMYRLPTAELQLQDPEVRTLAEKPTPSSTISYSDLSGKTGIEPPETASILISAGSAPEPEVGYFYGIKGSIAPKDFLGHTITIVAKGTYAFPPSIQFLFSVSKSPTTLTKNSLRNIVIANATDSYSYSPSDGNFIEFFDSGGHYNWSWTTIAAALPIEPGSYDIYIYVP